MVQWLRLRASNARDAGSILDGGNKFPHVACCWSVAQLCLTLPPHGPQRARLPCPSPSPGVCSNSCPLSRWCHPTISSYVVPFSSCLQYFPALRSFPMSWLFASGGQSIRASASASVLPMNIQSWFPLGWTGWISLQSQGLSRASSTPQFESINCVALSLLYGPALTSVSDYWKNHGFNYLDLCQLKKKDRKKLIAHTYVEGDPRKP